jgi:hypothetical protein
MEDYEYAKQQPKQIIPWDKDNQEEISSTLGFMTTLNTTSHNGLFASRITLD